MGGQWNIEGEGYHHTSPAHTLHHSHQLGMEAYSHPAKLWDTERWKAVGCLLRITEQVPRCDKESLAGIVSHGSCLKAIKAWNAEWVRIPATTCKTISTVTLLYSNTYYHTTKYISILYSMMLKIAISLYNSLLLLLIT